LPTTATGPLDFITSPVEALLGITEDADAGIARVQGEGSYDHDEKFHALFIKAEFDLGK